MNYVPGSSIIPFDDGSRASRITVTIGHTVDSANDKIFSSIFDDLFLIFDELGRGLPPNSMLVFLQIFISFYQFYITSFLPFLPEKWDFSKYPDKVLRYLTYPVDFGLGDTGILNNGIPCYFIILFEFLIVLYLSSIIIYHRVNKMFPKHNLRIICFILIFLIPILLPPSCNNIGFSFNKIFTFDTNSTTVNNTLTTETSTTTSPNQRTLYILSTSFGILLYLFLLLVFYVFTMFRSSTPYIENTPLSMWDGRPLFLCIFGCSFINAISRLIERLPSWADYLLILCCIAYNSYVMYLMVFFPMIKQWMNVFLSILIGSGTAASLFQLFPIPSLYRLVIPLCFFAIFVPLFIFLFRFMRKKYTGQIAKENITTEESALRYLRLSIAYKCEEFISFKWVRLMNHLDTPKIISQSAQIISLFPSESQNLTFYISLLTKSQNQLNLYQRFLLFEVRQVHILRQSNTSRQLNEDLHEISKVTNRSINSFSQFLIRLIDERQQLTLDGLNYLARINRDTETICHEAMARYPNNSRLLFIFSRYVIECNADFKLGVALFHEGQMIERGKKATIDLAFQSMINLFPNYLLKRILNLKGQINFKRKSPKAKSSTFDSISNDRESNRLNETEIESNEKIATNVIDNPRLRFALKKAVNNMSSRGLPYIVFTSIIRFLIGLIICIVLMNIVPEFLKKRSNNYNSIAQINVFRKSLDLCLFRTAKLWSHNLELAPKQDNISETLGPNISIDDYNNLTISPSDELYERVIESIKSNEKLGQLLIEAKYKQSANIVNENSDLFDKTKSELLHVKNISFCNKKKQQIYETSSSLRYFSLYILNQVASVTELDLEPTDWIHTECMCEIILNMNNIVSVLMEQSNILVSRERIYSDTVKKDLLLVIYISVLIVFCILLIPSIIGYVQLNIEFQHTFDVLNLLPIKMYKEASKPISIFQTEFEQVSDTVSQVEHKGCQRLTIILPAIICTILITCGFVGNLVLFMNVNEQFYTLVKWLEVGSLRAPLVIEVVTHCIFAGIYGYLGSPKYTSHEYHLSLLNNYSRELLLRHKSLIYGSSELKPCYDFNNELDKLHFDKTCDLKNNGETFRVNYKCLSLDQQLYTFQKLSNDVLIRMSSAHKLNVSNNHSEEHEYNQAFRNVLNDYESINLHYLGITHLLPKLEQAQNMLNDGITLQVHHLKKYSYLISLLNLAASLIIFIIELLVARNLKEEFNVLKILIARMSPISVAKNKQLVELIVGRTNKKSKKLTPIKVNIQNCSNSIIIFDKDLKIKLVNSAASKLFGYTKEQFYQSKLSLIIEKEDFEVIKDKCNRNHKQIESNNKNDNLNELDSLNENETNDDMFASLLNNNDDDIDLNNNNNKSSLSNEKIDLHLNTFNKVIVGVKDDGCKIILSAILAYLPAPDNVYALILKDETLLYVNKNDIDNAKQEVNEIINQILPTELVQNCQLKENVSFSVKQLTVITIKILNFNDSIPHTTSVQAIRHMTDLFMSFDAQLLNYPTLTKTCVISETYQAIGGLFNSSAIKASNLMKPDFFDSDISKTSRQSAGHAEIGIEEEEEENDSEIVIESENDSDDVEEEEEENDDDSDVRPNKKSNGEKENDNKQKNSDVENKEEENDVEDDSKSRDTNKTENKDEVTNNTEDRPNNDSKNDNKEEQQNKNEKNQEYGPNNNSKSIEENKEGTDNYANVSKDGKNNDKIEGGRNLNDCSNKSADRPDNDSKSLAVNNDQSEENRGSKLKVTLSTQSSRFIHSAISLYYSNISINRVEGINDIILDSIYFAFNCLDATEYVNSACGTNYVIGVGINVGGPCTAGTIGDEHMQFCVVGEAVKTSYLLCGVAEAGNIVVSGETFELLKESGEAQNNLVFDKYKEINLRHSKKTQTYITKLSEQFKQDARIDDLQSPMIAENNSNNNDNLIDMDIPLDQQMDVPDD